MTESDIFPDNFTRREIENIRKSCPNSSFGCPQCMCPHDIAEQTKECCLEGCSGPIQCSFRQCGCKFKGNTQKEMDEHAQNEMASHLNVSLFPLLVTFMWSNFVCDSLAFIGIV